MATPVVMPQMGESIAEGTIVRWIKKVGDAVDRDEPLFEISTDKVDAEIPSPVAGVLTEISVQEGETVAVHSVVATIGDVGEQPADPAVPAPVKDAEPLPRADASVSTISSVSAASTQVSGSARPIHPVGTTDDRRRQRSSPLVRRIAQDNDIDIGQITGSGISGRVTKQDILGYLERRNGASAAAPPIGGRSAESGSVGSGVSAYREGERVDVRPLSVMRRKIAEHMVMSRRTSAHVHTVFHVNFTAIDKIRQQKKAEYERTGTKLTYMAFIAKAVVGALLRYPVVNASLDGENVVLKKDINLGIAVALESGLIVPVIKNADEKNLLGLSKAIADLAERARTKRLQPEDVQAGTFTISNPGQFGAQFGMPIINQPQVAILGVGTIEKRPIVVDDAIAIRTMAYLTLGFDHRLVDGATADAFMADIRQQLEQFDPNQV